MDIFIMDSSFFSDPVTKSYFMRLKIFSSKGEIEFSNFSSAFDEACSNLKMEWTLENEPSSPNTLIFVSKYGHCLQDLLYKNSIDSLKMNVCGIVSNHENLKTIADNYSIPFFYIKNNSEIREKAEVEIEGLINDNNIELMILARYMQIFSLDFCSKYSGKVINIHHSFLPSFKGAKPYKQAYEKGVKIMGATAHYITEELDAGPIIEQTVERVDHSQSPEELELIGQDIESITLTRAVKKHLEGKVFINDKKTVVFD
jgi:formyltetrahydrofolate deformylase